MRPGKVDHCFSASKGTIKVSLVLTIPEPGQLVDVRQRRYVVVDVVEGTLPLDPLKVESLSQSYQHSQRQHLVALASVEDDDLGEELQVIWEVEPGVKVTERNALPIPVGFDAPERLDTFLDAVRWERFPVLTSSPCKLPFAVGLRWRITSLTRWCGPSRCRAP